MKYLWLLFIASNVFAADLPTKRLMWWELPRAVKADKKPYFEALNKYRDRAGEGSLLTDYLTALVLCELPTSFAERDCPIWQAEMKFKLTEPQEITLTKFSSSRKNNALLLRAFSGMLEGAKISLSQAGQEKANELLAQAGVLLASEKISEEQWKAFASVLNASTLWAEVHSNVSLKVYESFLKEFRDWLVQHPQKTELPIEELQTVVPHFRGICKIENNSFVCEGRNKPLVPAKFTNLRQVARNKHLYCAIDGSELNCWTRENAGGGAYFRSPPLGIKNPYFISSSGDDKFCVLDEEGAKCWSSEFAYNGKDKPELLSLNGLDNFRTIATTSDYVCAIGDMGLRCWSVRSSKSEFAKEITSTFRNPKNVVAGRGFFCAHDDTQAKCWGAQEFDSFAIVPQIENKGSFKQIIAGELYVCGLEDSVKCWGRDISGGASVPIKLGKQSKLLGAGATTCSQDDEGVNCWGEYKSGKGLFSKKLLNPRLVLASGEATYVLDDEGIKGWGQSEYDSLFERHGWQDVQLLANSDHGGHTYLMATPDYFYINKYRLDKIDVKNPREISGPCVVDDIGLRCFNQEQIKNPPTLISPTTKHPKSLSTPSGRIVFIDDDGLHYYGIDDIKSAIAVAVGESISLCYAPNENEVKCRGYGEEYSAPIAVKGLKKLISDGKDSFCVLDVEGAKCWNSKGVFLPSFSLQNPRQITVGYDHACVIDNDGVKCWGSVRRKPVTYPESVITK